MYTVLHKNDWGRGELAKFADIKELMEYVSVVADSYADDEIIIRLENGKYIMPFAVNSIIVLCHKSQWDARIAEHAFEYHGHENLTSPTKILGRLRDENSLLKREVECLREEMETWELDAEMWETRANEQLAKNEKLALEADSWRRRYDCKCTESEAWCERANEMSDDNMDLSAEKIELNKMLHETSMRERRHQLESLMWHTILVCGLDDVVVEFKAEVGWHECQWDMVYVLVNSEYDGDMPDLSGSPIDDDEQTFVFWHRNEDNYYAQIG